MPESKDPAFERAEIAASGSFGLQPASVILAHNPALSLPKEPALSLPKEPALSLPKGVSRRESSVFGCKDFLQVGLTVEAQRFSAASQHLL
jgi:hypothetical protein